MATAAPIGFRPPSAPSPVYPNNLKIWEFCKEDPQNFRSDRATIAQGQGASENENSEANPTQQKTKFSSCLGINDSRISPKLKAVVAVILQIALQIFFVFSVIIMTAALLPVSWLSGVVLVGAGAAMMAVSLNQFDMDTKKLDVRIEPLSPLLQPIKPQPIHLQAEPPNALPFKDPVRGIFKEGNNCWLNSVLQWLEADPFAAQWMRQALPQEVEPFIHYFRGYDLPASLTDRFRDFFQRLAAPQPIFTAFAQFLERIVPAEEDRTHFLKFRDHIYPNLLKLQPYLSQFFAAYDRAVAQNITIVEADSQILRLVGNQMNPEISPDPEIQLDAAEFATLILDLLPHSQKVHIEELNQYKVDGLIPMADHPEGVTRKEERTWGFCLGLGRNHSHPDLVELFHEYCNETISVSEKSGPIEHRNIHNDLQPYQLLKRTCKILEHPNALRFQLKRFQEIPPVKDLLGKIFSDSRPAMNWRYTKIQTPVQMPEVFPVEVNGVVQNYQLTAFDVHEGEGPHSGHYICYRRTVSDDGSVVYYRLDDHLFTRIDQRVWEEEKKQSYLVYYGRIEAGRSSANRPA